MCVSDLFEFCAVAVHTIPDRKIFVWPWNEKARTKQKQQTNGNKAIWLVCRTDTNARGFRLVKRTLGWKNFMHANFLEINRYFALTSYSNTIGQSNNTLELHIRVFFSFSFFLFFEESMFWSFHPLADKTNNQHHFSRSYENRSSFSYSVNIASGLPSKRTSKVR